MFMTLKKYFSTFLVLSAVVLARPEAAMAQAEGTSSGFVDDSLKDISIVLGAGTAGAILGLSTLSFVNSPSEHTKNIAVGGAIGIVVGVGIVIFSQATRSTAVIGSRAQVPLNPKKSEALARHEFSDYKIAQAYLKVPHIGYHFSF